MQSSLCPREHKYPNTNKAVWFALNMDLYACPYVYCMYVCTVSMNALFCTVRMYIECVYARHILGIVSCNDFALLLLVPWWPSSILLCFVNKVCLRVGCLFPVASIDRCIYQYMYSMKPTHPLSYNTEEATRIWQHIMYFFRSNLFFFLIFFLFFCTFQGHSYRPHHWKHFSWRVPTNTASDFKNLSWKIKIQKVFVYEEHMWIHLKYLS